jgi:hypothetical protein
MILTNGISVSVKAAPFLKKKNWYPVVRKEERCICFKKNQLDYLIVGIRDTRSKSMALLSLQR